LDSQLEGGKMKKLMFALVVLALLAIPSAAYAGGPAGKGGFDQYGYNDTARLFNGTGGSWCLEKGLPFSCLDLPGTVYANDKLIMKWNAAWDTCNAGGACAGAWTDNEWNGQVPGGSGETWHYKIVWVGPCTDPVDGGYCIWGNYEVILSQGTTASGHLWDTRAKPAGYGSYP
jgi:hypothetical protein